jgi:predicted ATPase/DNA-binding XRE family transcriptional regulator
MRDESERSGEGHSSFGRLLREFRLAARLSQEVLAERAGVSVDGVSALERGARSVPHRDTLALLAKALRLSAADLARLEAAAIRAPIPRNRAAMPGRTAAPGAHNLPLALTTFYGRDGEVQALAERVSAHRLVTLTGIGGIGKTRFALEAARTLVEKFPDGVWFVELAPLSDPGLLTQRMASTFSEPAPYEENGWSTAALVARLRPKRLLIVLDNCEHVIDAAASVTQQLLERCPNVHVLATSREALRIGGEFVQRVEPLRLPAGRTEGRSLLADLRAAPAVQLFLDRARHVAPALKPADDLAVWETLGNLCARLDGLPLAIELAAARMNSMTLETLSRALTGRFQLLTSGARTAMPRHQSMYALIDWSYGLLLPAEQRAFRRLAIFSGGWTLESAQAVYPSADTDADELLSTLSSLVDKSLVIADASSEKLRYTMLQTTRAYALDRLRAEDEHEATAQRHAAHVAELLRAGNAICGVAPMHEWLLPLEIELDNVRTALQWSLLDENDVVLGATIAVGAYPVLDALSLAEEACRWCERALGAISSKDAPPIESQLCLALARLYFRSWDYEQAVEAAMHAAALYRALTQPSMLRGLSARACLGSALSYAAFALVWLGRPHEADLLTSEALSAAREGANDGALSWALVVASLSAGDLSARLPLLDEALRLSRSLSSGYYGEGLVLIGYSLAEIDAANFDRARRYAAAAVEACQRSGRHGTITSWALGIEATCACLAGDLEGALACALDRLQLFGDGGGPFFFNDLADHAQVIAFGLAVRGCIDDAARLVGSVDAAIRGTHPRPNYAQLLLDRTMELFLRSASVAEVDAWRAQGRTWSYAESVEAALEFESRSRPSAAESHGSLKYS